MEEQNNNGSGRRSLLEEWLHIAVEKTGLADIGDYTPWLESQLLQCRNDLTEALILLRKFRTEFQQGTVYHSTLIQVEELTKKLDTE